MRVKIRNKKLFSFLSVAALGLSIVASLGVIAPHKVFAEGEIYTYVDSGNIRMSGGILSTPARLDRIPGTSSYSGGISVKNWLNNGNPAVCESYNFTLNVDDGNAAIGVAESVGTRPAKSGYQTCPTGDNVLAKLTHQSTIANVPSDLPFAQLPIPAGCPGGPAGPALPGVCEAIPAGCPGSLQAGAPADASKCPYYSQGNAPVTHAGTDTSGNGSQDDSSPQLNCTVSIINPLTWLVCPLVAAAQGAVNELNNGIDSLLTVDTTSNTSIFNVNSDSGQRFRKAWDSLRLFAVGIIIIAGLVMIIAQAAGVEFLDAYTIKKTLPRLLIAAIFITLSWYLLAFLIQLANDVGNSVRAVIYQPFQGMQNIQLNQTSTFVASLVGGAGVMALGLLGLGSFALTALLAVLIGFGVLVVRNLILMLLIIVAPFAIACYALPNTQKAWTFWKDTLISMLVVFPIISAFIAIGRVFAAVAYSVNGTGNGGGGAGLLATLEAFVAFFLPYFLLPFAFRIAGGAISTVAGIANDKTRGGFDRLKNFRKNKMATNMHDLKTGNRIKSDNWAANKFNATTRGIANVPNAGFNPMKMRSRFQAGLATHEAGEMAEYMEKNAAFNSIKGNDDYLQATMKNMGGGENEEDWRRYLSRHGYEGRGLEQGIAQIRAAKRGISNEVFERAAVMANASTGTGWKEGGVTQMMDSINEVAGGDRHTAATMLAQMRGMAAQSGRIDLAGSGFSTAVQGMNTMYEDSKKNGGEVSAATRQSVEKNIAKNMLFTKGANDFARARGQAIQHVAPAMFENLKDAHAAVDRAHASGNVQSIYQAERALGQEYAALDNLHDSLNHMSPENARILADTVFSKKINEQGTAMDYVQRLQRGGDTAGTAFLESKKSFEASRYAAEAGRPPEPEG